MRHKTNSSKTVSLLIGVLAMTFLIVLFVSAWTEPTTSPPAGNVDTPINVSNTDQLKSGKLGVSTDGVDTNYGLTVGNSTNLLGIKTNGDIQMSSIVIKGDGTLSTGLNADKLDDLSSADLMAAGGIPLILDQNLYSFQSTNQGSGYMGGSNFATVKTYTQDLSGAGADVNLIFIDSFRCNGTWRSTFGTQPQAWLRCCMSLSGAGDICTGTVYTTSLTAVSFDLTASINGKQLPISEFEKYMYMKNFGEVKMRIDVQGGCGGGCSGGVDSSYFTLNYRKTNQ